MFVILGKLVYLLSSCAVCSTCGTSDGGKFWHHCNGDIGMLTQQMCTFNVMEQKPGLALKEAADAGMGIIIKEGMANGRVFQSQKLSNYAKELSCEVDQLALAFILAQDFHPRVLSGAVTAEQLASNWRALEVADSLLSNPSLLEQISADCAVGSEAYWDERTALAWN